jgi:hypothetical protein
MESFKRSGQPDLRVYRRTEMPLFPAEPREEMEVRMKQWEALKAVANDGFATTGSKHSRPHLTPTRIAEILSVLLKNTSSGWSRSG